MSDLRGIMLHILFCLPGSIRREIYNVYDYFHYSELREQKQTYGEYNDDKTFYVIRPYTNTNEGLMSLLLNVCRQLIYAEKRGFIPVVDFKNYKTQYSDDSSANVWENYFYQTSDYSLDEVYASKNVVLSGLKPVREDTFEPYVRFNKNQVDLARKMIQTYIRVKKEVSIKLSEERANILPSKCIGVYLRGTDYLTVKPVGHYIQPSIEQVAPYIDSLLSNDATKNIYLVTEDYSVYSKMKERYQDKLKIASFDRFITDYHDSTFLYQSAKINQLADNKFERGLNYLIKELLLAECAYIIGGNTCGSWAAVAFSQDTPFYIMDLGRY